MKVSDVARQLGCAPTAVTQLWYQRKLPDNLAPVVRGRRDIPPDAIPQIREALAKCGKLPEATTSA